MLFAEKESNLIETFQHFSPTEIALFPMSAATENICKSLHDETRWKGWTDSSAKNAPPPDFFNDGEKLMMDVMRVDDHGFRRKGKTVNPTLEREHKLERELRESGVLGQFREDIKLYINADSGLPTKEDHNYQFYSDGFKRTVEQHIAKIPNYQKNHSGYKTIFFVFDESTAYVKMKKVPDRMFEGKIYRAEAHLWFLDKRFVEVFIDGAIDYLIWVAPYKLIQTIGKAPVLPAACVFDCHNIDVELMDYDMSHMVSSEV